MTIQMIRFNRKNSLAAGIASGVLLAGLTAGAIAARPAPASAAVIDNCSDVYHPSMRLGDSGSCVKVAQELLADQGYFTANPTGYFGPVTKNAVLHLQRDHGIEQLGLIGPKTWDVLTNGVGGNGGGASQPVTNNSASQLPAGCQTDAKTICIVKTYGSHATLYAVQNQQIIRSFPVRTGDARGPQYATTDGVWSVGRRYTMWHSTEYNNAPMPYSLFFHGGEAIHYSADFAQNGYGGAGSSAGCVNVGTMEQAQWLYDWSPLYTRVVVTG